MGLPITDLCERMTGREIAEQYAAHLLGKLPLRYVAEDVYHALQCYYAVAPHMRKPPKPDRLRVFVKAPRRAMTAKEMAANFAGLAALVQKRKR